MSIGAAARGRIIVGLRRSGAKRKAARASLHAAWLLPLIA